MNKIFSILISGLLLFFIMGCSQKVDGISTKKEQKELSEQLMKGWDEWEPSEPAYDQMPALKH